MELLSSESPRVIRRKAVRIGRHKSPWKPWRFLLLLLPLALFFWFFFWFLFPINTTAAVSPEKLIRPKSTVIPAIGAADWLVEEAAAEHQKSKIEHADSKPKMQMTALNMPQDDNKKKSKLRGGPLKDKPVIHNQDNTHQQHNIPNILIFTHSINLLNNYTSINNINMTAEDLALQRNVQNTIRLHPNATVRFLTDSDCIQSLTNVMGVDSPLLQFFQRETQGMFKADICRGAALYETGGLYLDVDVQARMPMWQAIDAATDFVVPLVHVASKHAGNFFQAFIGTKPQNPIMKRYLELFIRHYQGQLDVPGPLGVLLLRKAHDQVAQESSQTIQFWQEVLYRSHLFPQVPPPNWGTRRACKFVVVANKKAPFIVPLYSRTKGSRMCGGVNSTPSG